MTREEALRIFRKEIECLSHTKCEDCILEKACDPMITTPSDSEYIEAYSMAIKALEQEPRKGHWIKYEIKCMTEKRLTPVTHFIRECSVCHIEFTDFFGKMNFCPHCGVKMVEPQESEEV